MFKRQSVVRVDNFFVYFWEIFIYWRDSAMGVHYCTGELSVFSHRCCLAKSPPVTGRDVNRGPIPCDRQAR
jgi:hypothetical protein